MTSESPPVVESGMPERLATRDTELRVRRLSSESYRESSEGLRSDLRIAQRPLDCQREGRDTGREPRSIVSGAGVTRTRRKSATRVERSVELRGRNC